MQFDIIIKFALVIKIIIISERRFIFFVFFLILYNIKCMTQKDLKTELYRIVRINFC